MADNLVSQQLLMDVDSVEASKLKRALSAMIQTPNEIDFADAAELMLKAGSLSGTQKDVKAALNRMKSINTKLTQAKNYSKGIEGHHIQAQQVLHALTRDMPIRKAMEVFMHIKDGGGRISEISPFSKKGHGYAHYNPLTDKTSDFKYLIPYANSYRNPDPNLRAQQYMEGVGGLQEEVENLAQSRPGEVENREIIKNIRGLSETEFRDPNFIKWFKTHDTESPIITKLDKALDNREIDMRHMRSNKDKLLSMLTMGDVVQIGNNPRISSPGNNY